MIRRLKIFGWGVSLVGVIATFGNLVGWFVDADRKAVYSQLVDSRNISVTEPGVKSFLEEYYFSKRIPQYMKGVPIKGLVIKGIGMSSHAFAGNVHVKFENEKRSTPLCTLDELRQWSNETPLHAWLGLWLMLAGVIIAIVTDILSFSKGMKDSKSQHSVPPQTE